MVFMPQITFLSSAIFFGSYRVKNHLFNKQQLTYVLHNSVVIIKPFSRRKGPEKAEERKVSFNPIGHESFTNQGLI